MKTILLIISFIAMSIFTKAQGMEWNFQTNLSQYTQEASGMVYHDNLLYVVNDSGDSNVIWMLNPTDGTPAKVVKVDGVQNHDWETMAQDEEFIYIGDIGNNTGNRMDLSILKISKEDFINDTVFAEIIEYQYEDQQSFQSQPQNTKFDAEAMCVMGDSLYIFSKDWTQNKTTVYSLPKMAGNYTANKKITLDTPGLITGASYNENTETLILLGYTQALDSFILKMDNASFNIICTSEFITYDIPQGFMEPLQAETVCFTSENNFTVGSEYFNTTISGFTVESNASLYNGIFTENDESLSTGTAQNLSIEVYPNPTTNYLQLQLPEEENIIQYQVYDAMEKLVSTQITMQNQILVNHLTPGVYTIIVQGENGKYSKRFIKK